MTTLRTIALVALLAFGLASVAGRRGGGGGSHSSRNRSGTTGTGWSSSSHPVRGDTTRRDTSVAPHRQTHPDHPPQSPVDRGNRNPSIGKADTRNATR